MTTLFKAPSETLTERLPVLGEFTFEGLSVSPRGLKAGALLEVTRTGSDLLLAGGVAGEIYDLSVTLTLDDTSSATYDFEIHVFEALAAAADAERYATTADLIRHHGLEQVLAAGAGVSGALDPVRVAASLKAASDFIDLTLAPAYLVPLAEVPGPIKTAVLIIAYEQLHDRVPDDVRTNADLQRRMIKDLTKTDVPLEGLTPRRRSEVGGPIFTSPDRLFAGRQGI